MNTYRTKLELLKEFQELKDGISVASSCSNCINCYNCTDCNNCLNCINCNNCLNCHRCISCYDCLNCILCVGLSNKLNGYYVLNKAVTKEVYLDTLATLKAN